MPPALVAPSAVLRAVERAFVFCHSLPPPAEHLRCQPPPPPPNRRRNPNKSANKSADRFFSKKGSQCPGSQSQAPNTPSLWLLSNWSHVEAQNISQFSENFFSSLGLHSNTMAVHGNGPVVYALTHNLARVGSIPRPIFFAFLVTCLAEKIGFPCTNKAC